MIAQAFVHDEDIILFTLTCAIISSFLTAIIVFIIQFIYRRIDLKRLFIISLTVFVLVLILIWLLIYVFFGGL